MAFNGAKVRADRERKLLTLRDLSQRSGVAFDTISKIERNIQPPRPSTLKKLAEALEVPAESWWEDEKASA